MNNRNTTTRSGAISAAGVFLSTQVWVWPILAAVVLAIFGWWLKSTMESATRQSMETNLGTLLKADAEALKIWLNTQQSNAVAIASMPSIKEVISRIVKQSQEGDPADLRGHEDQQVLRALLKPWLAAYGYDGFGVVNREAVIVACQRDAPVGEVDMQLQDGMLNAIFQYNTVVTRPFRSAVILEQDGVSRAGLPTMFALAPVLGDNEEVIAAFGVRIRPDRDFTRILSIARAGVSGETYAFDARGVMLSQSRFEEQLKQIGLLVDQPDIHSILNLEIRDPQVNMVSGERPQLRRADQPFTLPVARAIAGESGVNVEGYRDYRGVPVVGAWTWLSDHDFGIATEVDRTEAYRPIYILRGVFWTLFGLLFAGAVITFVFGLFVSHLNRKAQSAQLKALQLGQYTLEEKIGAGGMGTVYRAHHAMLRRPTAVKLLDPERTNEASIVRFEREVQLTSRLNHPNTIAIYDFGRTPEGLFYYAMEYLDGVTLEDLVKKYEALPQERVIPLLSQICGSLHEAHQIGLIHRDIKPANIIVNQRGGLSDVIKLLDFGLVKAVDGDKDSSLTSDGSLTGTPLYLSPEGIHRPQTVDARSDLYAVGAVAYFLLVGAPVFDGANLIEVCNHQVNTPPVPPSQRSSRPIDPELETIVLKCLAKDPAQRPQSATELAAMLAQTSVVQWSQEESRSWWEETRPTPDTVGAESTVDTEPVGPFDRTILLPKATSNQQASR